MPNQYSNEGIFYNKANSYNNTGGILGKQGKYSEAEEYFLKAISLEPGNAHFYYNLALILHNQKKFDQAAGNFLKAIELKPGDANFYYKLGLLYYDQEKLVDASGCLLQAISLKPDQPEYYTIMGTIFQEQKKYIEAVKYYLKVIELEPENFKIYNNIGAIFHEQNNFGEAEKYYLKAISLRPDDANLHYNLGLVFDDAGKFNEAMEKYRYAVNLQPNHAYAHYSLSHSLLLQGKFREGWKEYEWRFFIKKSPGKLFEKLYWDGTSLEGKTIYVFSEFGLGDTIQFCRYLPMVKAKGGKVIFGCFPELINLLKKIAGFDEIVEASALPLIKYDAHAGLMSLPGIFGTTINSVPGNIPYIEADKNKKEKWTNYFKNDHEFKIGIVWETSPGPNHHNRSCPIENFFSLSQIPGVKLYSLQKENTNPGSEIFFLDVPITNPFSDFTDTAAIISNLDLVISVDTSVAHLAGAMGKPVWTLLPFSANWRWLLERDDSPWYPTMRLFRQSKPGHWNSVFEKLITELKLKIKS